MMSPRSNVFALAACVLLTCAGCLPARPEPQGTPLPDVTPASLVGCYTLHTADGGSIGGRFPNASSLVRLDTALIAGVSERGVVRRLVPLDAAGYPMDGAASNGAFGSSWTHREGGLLKLAFSDGFTGTSLMLAAPGVGDTLRGIINKHSDVGPHFTVGQGAAYAVRIPCREP
jgi:hypothetical protein